MPKGMAVERGELTSYRAYDYDGDIVVDTSSLPRFLAKIEERPDREYLTLKTVVQTVIYFPEVEHDVTIKTIQ